jgi:hypothetical protein
MFSGPSENVFVRMHLLEHWYNVGVSTLKTRDAFVRRKSMTALGWVKRLYGKWRSVLFEVQGNLCGREAVNYRRHNNVWRVLRRRVLMQPQRFTECHATEPLDWESCSVDEVATSFSWPHSMWHLSVGLCKGKILFVTSTARYLWIEIMNYRNYRDNGQEHIRIWNELMSRRSAIAIATSYGLHDRGIGVRVRTTN